MCLRYIFTIQKIHLKRLDQNFVQYYSCCYDVRCGFFFITSSDIRISIRGLLFNTTCIHTIWIWYDLFQDLVLVLLMKTAWNIWRKLLFKLPSETFMLNYSCASCLSQNIVFICQYQFLFRVSSLKLVYLLCYICIQHADN